MKPVKDERRWSLYFPFRTAKEIAAVAERLSRPKSWVLQRAWEVAKERMIAEKPRYSEAWKNDFVDAVNKISRQTAKYPEDEIEAFAVREGRKNRKIWDMLKKQAGTLKKSDITA